MAAAARELKEETNLRAELSYKGVYHEHVVSAETGELLEDKIFHIIGASNPNGDLTVEFEGGMNAWKTLDELMAIEKKYSSCDIETDIGTGKYSFIEKTQIYTKDEF